MAYIGKKVEETELANRTVDTMTGDGSDTTMSLSATPISVNNVLVFFNGVMQRPTTDFTLSGSTITFAAAPFTGAVVVAITGEGGHIGRPSSPLPTEKFMDSAITNAKLMSGIASSKLTGAMPALDGAALTGGGTPYTESASDPVVTTNPSTGVGTFWVNKSSGEVYCCTDATAGENIWVNIGAGSGDTHHAYGGVGGGTTYGFSSGGSQPGNYFTLIRRFSFSSGSGETWGNLTLGRDTLNVSGASSSTHGFVLNGYAGAPINAGVNVIDKFPFASGAGATDFGDLNFQRSSPCVSYDATRAYVAGGRFQVSPPHANQSNIQTFLFANNSSNTNHGDLSRANNWASPNSSKTHGYVSGGANTDGGIDKFAYASSGGTRLPGDLNGGVATTKFQFNSSGHSSDTKGFHAGGSGQNSFITSFSFASDSAAGTSHGNLVRGIYTHSGSTSTTHGYLAGGEAVGVTGSTTIQKFSFDNGSYAQDIGDLVGGLQSAAQGNED